MTRRLRPPAPIEVQHHPGPGGTPLRLRRGRRTHRVTRVTSTWIRPAAWWSHDDDDAPADPLFDERTYYRVVLDDALVYEIFRTTHGDYYLERIID